MPNPDRLSSSGHIKTYATIDADVDLQAAGPGGPCRWFTVGTAGDVKVTTADGTTDVITCAVGFRYWAQVTSVIDTGTTAAKITFYW